MHASPVSNQAVGLPGIDRKVECFSNSIEYPAVAWTLFFRYNLEANRVVKVAGLSGEH